MLEGPAQEKSWVSWLYVVIWSLVIYVTIPFVRAIQKYVAQNWGREVFTYVVLTAIITAFVAVAQYVIRHRTATRSSYFWLLAVAAFFVGYTVKLSKLNPEEAIHFLQYGILGILVFRALTHRFRDLSIYFIAAIICGIIGLIDEFIQWITPKRVWDLRDIWINFLAASLVQVAIAKGLKLKFIDNLPDRVNLRFLCCLTIGATILLWVCLLNTPARIVWYTQNIPWLAFLKDNDCVMLEYGYLYSHQDTGIFRSRFSAEELRLIDRRRAKEAAEILDRYQDASKYREFLKIYTPVSDPFVHEARVHLFSRDLHFTEAEKYRKDPKKFAWHLNIAYRENQIMDTYFTNTLRYSAYIWPAGQLDIVKKHLLPDWIRESWVSRELVTRVNETQVSFFFTLFLMVLAILHWYFGKYPARKKF